MSRGLQPARRGAYVVEHNWITKRPSLPGRVLQPGTRVRITQTIVGRAERWRETVEGDVISHQAEQTGSWYAHGKNHRVWLNRIRLRKPDGEITTLALDQNSCVTILSAASTTA